MVLLVAKERDVHVGWWRRERWRKKWWDSRRANYFSGQQDYIIAIVQRLI
jgi:hypothetical protein